MLKPAYGYKDRISSILQEIAFSEEVTYWNHACYWSYETDLKNDSWRSLHFVSVDDQDNILGLLFADICRPENFVDAMAILNLKEKGNFKFSRDLYQFLDDLFVKFNFFKMTFCVVSGNPVEKMYDRFVLKFGGRIIGVYKQQVMLQDGKLYDQKHYELFREDYMERRRLK